METKHLGFVVIGLSVVLGGLLFNYMGTVGVQQEALHCNPTQECQQLQSSLGTSHMVVGFLAFFLALGFYMALFGRQEQKMLARFEAEKKAIVETNHFDVMLKPLDEYEKRVLCAVREQDGITQSTLKFRTDLSKAKLSQILTDFERKKLIVRQAKGKTYSVHLAIAG